MTTKELALELMKAKILETGDKVLARALGMKLVNSQRKQELRGQLVCEGKRKGVSVWRWPKSLVLNNRRFLVFIYDFFISANRIAV